MTDACIQRWAYLLVHYCVALRRRETVVITGELPARPLIAATFREALRVGAYPRPYVTLPEVSAAFLREANRDQLRHTSPVALYEARHAAARIAILSSSNTREASGVDPSRQALQAKALDPIRRRILQKRWTLTLFPTHAYAQEADMSLDDYEAFVTKAMFLDRPDPIAAWKQLGRRQARLIQALARVRQVHIQGPGTDLRFSVAGRRFINSDGHHNMPSGEVFTGPVESSVEGTLACSYPVCTAGRQIDGIRLEFRQGRVVRAAATKNEAYLRQMLDLDAGARRLGEFGIGLNYGIDRFTGNILFDEKIGGSVHLALGMSYPETRGRNKSALHWDLIVDLRREGEIRADGRVVMHHGRWRLG